MSEKQMLKMLDDNDEELNRELKKRIRAAVSDYKPANRANGMIAIRFGTKDIDYLIIEVLDAYRKKHDWSWKLLLLRGVAEMAANEGNTPLAETIVDYLLNRKFTK